MTSTISPATSRLAALSALGTSVWLDLLRRSLYTSGELQRLVEEDSLVGMTSNPSIFQKAILGSDDYDEDLRAAAENGSSAQEIYERLAIADVQAAADVLRPVYERTGGGDGYVSLEVGPELARDTEGSLRSAQDFWRRLDRPNVMIKIPGTPEGVPAIRDATAAGVNINVTLLFALDAYAAVADAYLTGLEARVRRGEPIDRIASVASFFVSRVDTAVDKRLEVLGRTDLAGSAAIANARAAYAHHQEILASERWAALREHGANPQRVLWASTGTKNPAYSDVLYIEQLAGPGVVNTMPMQTLLAFQDHGEAQDRISDAGEQARRTLAELSEAGIDLDEVTDELLAKGIDAFAADMAKLVEGIERRRAAVIAGTPEGISSDLDEDSARAVGERVREEPDLARRVWRKDHTLWGPEPEEISDRLGWLDVAEQTEERLGEIESFADEVRGEGFEDVVLLGMGGSSLAPLVFARSFGAREGYPRLHVLDSTHPDAVAAAPVEKSLFVVSSKSGSTLEPRRLYEHFHARVGGDGRRFVAITDPDSPLAGQAAADGFRRVFLAPPDIGGRYSALSQFGIVPAALAGVDVRGVLERAAVAQHASAPGRSCEEAPALWLGLALGELARRGRDKLTFVVDEPLGALGLWLEQLVAESTGKEGTGIVPIAGEPLGQAGDYGADRVFAHIGRGEVELPAPSVTLPFEEPVDLGSQMYTWELAIAIAGHVLGINSFDQPNVQEAKDLTNETIAEYERSGEPPEIESTVGSVGELEGSYLAILAYLAPDPDVDAALAELRVALRARHGGIATTAGYGPRYLHSTGQLHKGGPPTGAFLLLTDTPQADLPDFAALVRAQAAGDAKALVKRGRPLCHVDLGSDPAGAIRKLTEEVRG